MYTLVAMPYLFSIGLLHHIAFYFANKIQSMPLRENEEKNNQI